MPSIVNGIESDIPSPLPFTMPMTNVMLSDGADRPFDKQRALNHLPVLPSRGHQRDHLVVGLLCPLSLTSSSIVGGGPVPLRVLPLHEQEEVVLLPSPAWLTHKHFRLPA